MKLVSFHVTDFRSIEDSGWIETDEVTTLIGVNESGKTNLLVPLWKLNPAKEGEIDPIADYPRKRYNEIRAMTKKPVFIRARFELSDTLLNQVAEMTQVSRSQLHLVEVSRDFAGEYDVDFPDVEVPHGITKSEIVNILECASDEIEQLSELKTEADRDLKEKLLSTIESAKQIANTSISNHVDLMSIQAIQSALAQFDSKRLCKTGQLAPRYRDLLRGVGNLQTIISRDHPRKNPKVQQLVKSNMPSFVYYSHYGNLDSEIYLPHVIKNMQRGSLGVREEAKARTLKVLFEFVNLKPEEILELGRDYQQHPNGPTDEQITETAKRKKEREILLQSASTDLTRKFRDWWKQGEYRFRFQADGDHFRIWVSDDKRPEEIELEGRSSGLQWFFSFYLVFLVESQNTHRGAILLLDEPGLSLHPLSQRDLSKFFNNLSQTNQLLYTTHSPFMVDADRLDRVKAVYTDNDGSTAVSADLRASEIQKAQSNSIYSVHAALGLSVSDVLLRGCSPVIVEGISDQLYLSTIKNYLINKGLIAPLREIVFLPAGGVRGVKAIVAIVSGVNNEELPYVILDDDHPGRNLASNLKKELYSGTPDRVLCLADFTDKPNCEIEDLWPTDFLTAIITKYLRGPELDFDEVVQPEALIVPQVEAYADRYQLPLEKPGWKVDVAQEAKKRLLQNPDQIDEKSEQVKCWAELFAAILST